MKSIATEVSNEYIAQYTSSKTIVGTFLVDIDLPLPSDTSNLPDGTGDPKDIPSTVDPLMVNQRYHIRLTDFARDLDFDLSSSGLYGTELSCDVNSGDWLSGGKCFITYYSSTDLIGMDKFTEDSILSQSTANIKLSNTNNEWFGLLQNVNYFNAPVTIGFALINKAGSNPTGDPVFVPATSDPGNTTGPGVLRVYKGYIKSISEEFNASSQKSEVSISLANIFSAFNKANKFTTSKGSIQKLHSEDECFNQIHFAKKVERYWGKEDKDV
jgi:hypothetical protein